MKLANSADNYGLISKLFHWIMAALIIATYLLGKNLENNFEYYYEILMIHNTLGLVCCVSSISHSNTRNYSLNFCLVSMLQL